MSSAAYFVPAASGRDLADVKANDLGGVAMEGRIRRGRARRRRLQHLMPLARLVDGSGGGLAELEEERTLREKRDAQGGKGWRE